jgi:RNA polymerase sigma-70 factor (ECF subfamily)
MAMEAERARRFFERGRARWPALPLDFGAFTASVSGHIDKLAGITDEEVHAEDLFLAAACLSRVEGAADALDAFAWPQLSRQLFRLERDNERMDELRQTLLVMLLVPAADGKPPRLVEYAGRGPLLVWLRMTASRLSLMARRERNRETSLSDSYAQKAVGESKDIELSFIRGRYEKDFVAALREAVAGLTADQRLLLQFRYRDELTSDQIAVVLKTSRVTAHRRVVAAREALGERLRGTLQSRLALSDSGLVHLMGLLSSRLVPALTAELRDGLAG